MSNIYYSAKLHNNSSDITKASFDVTFDQPLLDDISKYKMTIQQFSLPTQMLPLLIYRDNYYQVGITWNNLKFFKTIPFVPVINLQPTVPDFYYLYSYTNLIKMINIAIYELFQDLKNSGFIPTTNYAPFIVYSEIKSQFYINFPRSDWERNSPSSTNPILYFNDNLYSLFDNFETFCYISGSSEAPNLNNIWYALQTSYTGYNNSFGFVPGYLGYSLPLQNTEFIVNYQEFSNLSSTLEPISILLTTSKIPTRPQNYNAVSNPVSNDVSDSVNGSSFSYQIQKPSDIRSRFIYHQQEQPTYWIDLLGSGPLKTLSFEFYWTNKKGEIYPIYIAEYESVEVVFVFQKIKNKVILQDMKDNQEQETQEQKNQPEVEDFSDQDIPEEEFWRRIDERFGKRQNSKTINVTNEDSKETNNFKPDKYPK